MKNRFKKIIVFVAICSTTILFLNLRLTKKTILIDESYDQSEEEHLRIIKNDSCGPGNHKRQTSSQDYMPKDKNHNGKVVFRYRTFQGKRPKYVSKGATDLIFDEDHNIKTYDRGEFFDDLWVTKFENNYYSGVSKIKNSKAKTIQAWFQTSPYGPDQQTIFSNLDPVQGGGLALKIVNSKIVGILDIKKNKNSFEELKIESKKLVADDKWHHVAFTMNRRIKKNQYWLCLYIDSKLDTCKKFKNKKSGPKESKNNPTVGAQKTNKWEFVNFFEGELYAVTVHDYRVHGGFFKGRVLRDGSRYFNMPSYNDYLHDKMPNDLWLKKTLNSKEFKFNKPVRERFTLPFADDHYVPQGISIENSSIYVSYYYKAAHKSKGCSKDNPKNYPSIVVEFSRCNSKILNVYSLYIQSEDHPNKEHVGGIAVVEGEDRTYAFIPRSDGGIYKYILKSNLEQDNSKILSALRPDNPIPRSLLNTEGNIKKLVAPDIFITPECEKNSYISYNKGNNSLWFGKFEEEKNAFICRYKLSKEFEKLTFKKRHKLPIRKVQGAAYLKNGAIALSKSFGHNKSKIFIWKPNKMKSFFPYGFYYELLKGPPGFEDLTLSSDGLLYTVSESGASYYQKRGSHGCSKASWEGFYPYIFGISVESLIK